MDALRNLDTLDAFSIAHLLRWIDRYMPSWDQDSFAAWAAGQLADQDTADRFSEIGWNHLRDEYLRKKHEVKTITVDDFFSTFS